MKFAILVFALCSIAGAQEVRQATQPCISGRSLHAASDAQLECAFYALQVQIEQTRDTDSLKVLIKAQKPYDDELTRRAKRKVEEFSEALVEAKYGCTHTLGK